MVKSRPKLGKPVVVLKIGMSSMPSSSACVRYIVISVNAYAESSPPR